ncbi:MAG: hypothetical protein AAF921_00580 [Cyanobacteria bacterium P01_D01_bin.44]
MSAASTYRMTERCRARSYRRWHRLQSKLQILRSQLGFNHTTASCPSVCEGCQHYHGIAYGTQERVQLVCAFHPYGWLEPTACPDWCG